MTTATSLSYARWRRALVLLAAFAAFVFGTGVLQQASANGGQTLHYGGTVRTKVAAQLNTPNDHLITVTTFASSGQPIEFVKIDGEAPLDQGQVVVDTSDTTVWKAPVKTTAESWTITTKAVNSSSAGVYINGVLKPLNPGAVLTVKFIGGAARPKLYFKLTGFAPTGIGAGKVAIEAETSGTGALQHIVVTSVFPEEASVVPTGTGILIYFSEIPGAIDPDLIVLICNGEEVEFTFVDHGTHFELIPVVPLPPGSECSVTIPQGTVTDTDPNDGTSGLPFDYVFEFETDAAPEVTSVTPEEGDYLVPIDQEFVVTFSEEVDLTGGAYAYSCTGGASGVGGAAATGVTQTTVSESWPAGETCTVTFNAALVTDSDLVDQPDAMAADYSFQFVTDAAPSVVSIEHILGPVIGLIPTFVVEFSEPVNVAPALFPLFCSISGPLGLGGTLGGSNTTTIYVTTASVVAGDICTLTIPAGAVSDVDEVDPADNMLADQVFIYLVDSAPQLLSSSGPQTVVKNTQVTVSWTFDEPVDAAITFVRSCGIFSTAFIASVQTNTNTISYTFTRTTAGTCTVGILGVIGDTDLGDPPNLFLGLLPTASVTFTN